MVEFWLKNETKSVQMMLPVTPEGYENNLEREIETVRATEKGDIHVLGWKKPQSISISGFFPENEYSFTRDSGVTVNTAMDYVHLLEEWITDGDIVRIIIADEKGAKLNAQFYLGRIQYSSKKEDNGDIPFTLSAEEYIPMQTATISKASTASGTRADTASQAAKAKSYTVQKGDCLWAIARAVYGDATKWQKIYEANKSTIGGNPNLIYPGQVYTIP